MRMKRNSAPDEDMLYLVAAEELREPIRPPGKVYDEVDQIGPKTYVEHLDRKPGKPQWHPLPRCQDGVCRKDEVQCASKFLPFKPLPANDSNDDRE